MYRFGGLLLATTLLASGEGWISNLMNLAVEYGAIYPAILGILVIASLGVPIPEDVPLILAGVVLKTIPGAATWTGVLVVSMIGIMSGDCVLYMLGRRWGRDVFSHRWVNRLVTPQRFDWLAGKFHDYGVWACFFGRFFMGIRAAMCLTAGATRFPYWKFFLADFAGALLSVPFFVILGYWFADKLPMLFGAMQETQAYMLGGLLVLAVVGVLIWKIRKFFKATKPDAAAPSVVGGGAPAAGEPGQSSLTATNATADTPVAASAPTGLTSAPAEPGRTSDAVAVARGTGLPPVGRVAPAATLKK
ncbi:MAG: VTT domain-containing protein [Planctomycetia bacterium]|nr:MAG: VTT domain-containing protein [Planctomycetia bacterium]